MTLEVLAGKKVQSQPEVIVKMDGKIDKYNDFVVFGYNPHLQSCSLLSNADLITFAMALETIADAFNEKYAQATPEEQALLTEFIKDRG